MKKAQSALEFMILVIAAIFLLSTFSLIFYQNIAQKNVEKRNEAVMELALNLQNELEIAAKATDGYSREFELPNKIVGLDYSVSLVENSIYLNTSDGLHSLALSAPNVTGQFIKGSTNVIRKQNTIVMVN